MNIASIRFLALSWLVSFAYASPNANTTTNAAFKIDPYLEYRPAFARSLPVQILMTGIVLTLTSVLLIHLIFTAQYHWPLAPVNCALQISGVTTLLISLIATLHVILSMSFAESESWPYMLSYLAVNVPPQDWDNAEDWTVAERATWMVMNATTSGLIQITHIQFLTLLFPSRMEARLIFFLLGPLAILAAVMQLIPIQNNSEVTLVASAVRNVCNATLSLLFTGALFIWGLLVNRRQAWRTDGGTAAFGAAALVLAIVSTALNFLYVPREEEYQWMPSLMWAIVLWQSFLGWWWWVGAGSGSSGDEERVEKLLKREMRRSKKLKRQQEKEDRKLRARGLTRRVGRSQQEPQLNEATISSPGTRRSSMESPPGNPRAQTVPQPSYTPSNASSSGNTYATLPRVLPNFVHRWYARLRTAHLTATHQQAAERVQRIRRMQRSGGAPIQSSGPGWGLGSFGFRLGGRERELDEEPRAQAAGGVDISPGRHNGEASLRERRSDGGLEVEERGSDCEVGGREHERDSERGRTGDRDSVSGVVGDGRRSESTSDNRQGPHRTSSMWWWGPLGRWRLQDSTVY